ncbi:HutD family protein [Dokdonella sp.]|uniref:HutD/Ves family protein n=1 Tax=Dokdonella sp. TaxID=2291710 RepID=UPI0031C3187E|nr:HutD family protein [Dokdonella sp.]
MRLIPANACRRQRWKNDGGWTTEIARSAAGDGEAGEFLWRVSIAEIETDGPFSLFPGVTRDLLLLGGNGIELTIGEAEPMPLTRRFARAHFDGALPVQCRLIDGPTRDFNVMTRSADLHADVLARPLVGTMIVPPDRGVHWLIHVLAGQASASRGGQRLELQAGDSLLLEDPLPGSGRLLLEGGGELLLVRFAPALPA